MADTTYANAYELHIYGDGVLRKQVEEAAQHYANIYYYGHVPKQEVFAFRATCQYTLMPSTFLETFGLVALDSLSVGVPVLGYRK
ncbi:MAG: glycosyltransferase [Candidatus Peribacteria bacterium]|nr:MAG: glycosyltransferase [Candidatus Peribacteria bacterium]